MKPSAPKPDLTAGFRFPKRQDRPSPSKGKPLPPQAAIQRLVDEGVVTFGAPQPKPQPPLRCRAYLDYVALQPCCCPGCKVSPAGDPHHDGPRGVGQKTDDPLVAPLCRKHHNFIEAKLHLPGLTREQTDGLIAKMQVRLFVRWMRETGVWTALQEAGVVPR